MILIRRDGVRTAAAYPWFQAMNHDDDDFTVFLIHREEGEEDFHFILDWPESLPEAEALHMALDEAANYKRRLFDIGRWAEQYDKDETEALEHL